MTPRSLRAALALGGVAACAAEPSAPPAPPSWTYAPLVHVWGLGADAGRIGRGEAVQPTPALGITGPAALTPLRAEHAYAVPGVGAARAVVAGRDDAGQPALDVIDVDAGRVLRRAACAVVAVTADLAVCRDADGAHAIALADGAVRWRVTGTVLAASEDRIVIAAHGADTVDVVDAQTGQAGVTARLGGQGGRVAASCGPQGRELYVWLTAKAPTLARLDVSAAGVARVAWTAVASAEIDLRCDDDRVRARDDAGPAWLRVTGAPTSAPPRVLAARGDRWLIAASAHAAAILDAGGARALLGLAPIDAVLGDRAVLAVTAAGEVRRLAIPRPWGRRLRAYPSRGIAVPAELRDRPAPSDPTEVIAAPGALGAATAIAFDPDDAAQLYVTAGTALARLDLRARAWTTLATDACPGPGGLAVIPSGVVCAGGGAVRGLDRQGHRRWERAGGAAGIAAAGDVAIAFDGARVAVLAADDGRVLGELASDDGDAMRAAAVALDGEPWLVALEGGRLVARLARAHLVPVWSLGVDGTVRAVIAAGDAVIIELDDGDAYRVDVRTGGARPIAAIGQRWHADADAWIGATAGGPIPPPDTRWVPPPPPPLPPGLRPPPPPHVEVEPPPPFATIVWPAPPPLAPSLQVTLYEPTGAVRARNDYALAVAARFGVRGAAGSPIVVADERDLLVVDPRRGDAVSRIAAARLPDAIPFSTVVDGVARAGAVVGSPLRVVLFSPGP